MADISTRMNVTGISQYKQAMQQAKQSVKTLDEELKRNEAQFKATGDKESYMADKAKLLEMRMQTQKAAAAQAEAALKAMRAQGVDPLNTEYQRMQQEMSRAQTGMLETCASLNELKTGATEAAQGADQLTTSVNGINKKVSLDAVISGIDTVTSALENAARKAVEFGKTLWREITEAASSADNIATSASMLGMGIEDYQRYQQVFDTVADITVSDWMKAKQKVLQAINSPSGDQADVLSLLGIKTHVGMAGKTGMIEGAARDFEDVFWEIGEKLREKVASGEMTADLADTYANAIFGRSFMNLNPLFDLGREGFAEALEKQNVVSEDAVKRLAELNDAIDKMQTDFKNLESEVLSGMAPALQKAAEVLDSLLGKLMEYLQTEEGQAMLERMGQAVEGLFTDLASIDPEQVVEGFTGVFNGIVESFQWLVNNAETIKGILVTVVGAWGAAKLTGGALQVLQLVNGIRGLQAGNVAAGAAAAAGSAAGQSWGAAFAGAVAKAAPWLVGAYALLKPSETADDTFFDENGNMTDEGKQYLDENGDYKNRGWEIQDMQQRQKAAMDALWEKYKNAEDHAAEFDVAKTLFGGQEELFNGLMQKMQQLKESGFEGSLPEGFFEVEVTPVTDENAAANIAEQVGTVEINGVVHITDVDGNNIGVEGNGWGGDGSTVKKDRRPKHANGLYYVPYDGYTAVLHRGERVLPAREVNNRSFSSNLYVESMYMNNGMDADALGAAIAERNKRTMNGFGS